MQNLRRPSPCICTTLRVSASLNLVPEEPHLPSLVQAWLAGFTLSFPIHSSPPHPRLVLGVGSIVPMWTVVNKEENFKKEGLSNRRWDYSEGSSDAFGYTEATRAPRPKQIQEGLVMNDLSWSAPPPWAQMVDRKPETLWDWPQRFPSYKKAQDLPREVPTL